MAPQSRSDRTKGSKPDKILRDALILELNREYDDTNGQKIKKISKIVAKLVENGMEGKTDAIKEIFDRVEGKPAQSVAIGQDPELEPIGINHVIRPVLTRDEWLRLHSDK